MGRPVVLVSNRGPLAFARDDAGALVARRGGGGLVSGLAPLVAGTDALWLAAAMSDDDRAAAADGVIEAEGLRVRLLPIEPATYRAYYDVICNATLWFCLHGLFDAARRPRIDGHWRAAWNAYREVNSAFAAAIAESAPESAVVLVQDYHLALVGPALRASRPDVRAVHFSHTPFCWPDGLRPMPDDCAAELLEAMSSYAACTFHTRRWARAFEVCCDEVLDHRPTTAVTPLAPDATELRDIASGAQCEDARRAIDETLGDRKMILRVDRIELSKNLLRGFHAYDELLTRHPEWRERVEFAAFVYPSREGLPEYLGYRQEVEGLVRRLNDKWATDDWTPIRIDTDDDFPRSIAALRRSDVLLVNPIRDGMNLVAMEGPIVNERDGVLVLSTEAGAWATLGHAGAVDVNPFDVGATADALYTALSMPAAERAERAACLRKAASSRSPADWLAEQLALAD
jgi:trehalose 6-phosphate synthase